jgi:hypothetical protein
MIKRMIVKIWRFFTQEEGMTWDRYHRNMERRKKNENNNR